MIRIITPMYNAEKYIGYCLASINMQTYKNWKCYICDDMSTDGSVELVKKLIERNDKFELIENKEKLYTTGNHYQVIHRKEINDDDIIIDVDGDDRLFDDNVFERVIRTYNNNDTLITYGSFVHWDGTDTSDGFAQPPENGCINVRESRYTTTHLRTYKSMLFRKIKEEDLKINGEFIQSGGDLAFMYPMLEMAGDSRSVFLEDINYIYNIENSLCDYKVDLNTQTNNANYFRNKERYKEL